MPKIEVAISPHLISHTGIGTEPEPWHAKKAFFHSAPSPVSLLFYKNIMWVCGEDSVSKALSHKRAYLGVIANIYVGPIQ